MSTGASSSGSDAKELAEGRLGGARADFVASLGRKVADAREILAAIEAEPSSTAARGELRRRMHALGTGARLLRFGAMAGAIQEGLALLDRGAHAGELTGEEVAFLAQLLDDLPALVWGDAPSGEAPGSAAEDHAEALAQLPVSVLVVGDDALADALTDGSGTHTFECERTEDVSMARDLARAYAPDLVLMDADLERSAELAAALLDDPLTEPVPIVVVGTFHLPEDEARFVALGVARALTKPASGDVLRLACDEVLDVGEDRTTRVNLGEPTLEQLADRLAQELRSALVDSVDPGARSSRVPLGEGTEVLGALWGAIARVQEVVTQKTGGAVRFSGGAPEGAIALAPWLHHDLAAADRATARGRGAGADVRLSGRRVVVADDDPGVTWFLSDLLRTAGCEVHEALDGITARDLSFRVQPELVVSDILMPGLDGFGLCRALKRDVALRDTPVILLSWKEDLLQRVRELGASAAAYMRKESDSRAVLARVREVLRPRARIEGRLRADGEVRGRLDGLSPRLLLDLVCTIRKDARVAVRDLPLRDRDSGRRSTSRGSHGERWRSPGRRGGPRPDAWRRGGPLRRLVEYGSGAGRDVGHPLRAPLPSPRCGAGGTLCHDGGSRDGRGSDLPRSDGARRIPRGDARSGSHAAPATGPRRVAAPDGDGRRRVAEPDGGRPRRRGRPLRRPRRRRGGRDGLASPGGRGGPRHAHDGPADVAVTGARCALERARPSPQSQGRAQEARPVFPESALMLSEPPPPPSPPAAQSTGRPTAPEDDDDEDAPSSLEDAVMREISDRSPIPGVAHPSSPNLPPLIEPSALRPRSSNPPATEVVAEPDDRAILPSIPPDAIVPAASSLDEVPAASAASLLPGSFSTPPPAEAEQELSEPAAPVTSDATPIAPPPEMDDLVGEAPVFPHSAPSQPPAPREPPASLAPPKPMSAPAPPEVARPREPWGIVIAFALLGGAVAAVWHVSAADSDLRVRPAESAISAAPAAAPAAADELPPGIDLPPGYGVLDVIAPPGASVQVDGQGVTPPSAAPPGHHEVRVESGGRVQQFGVEVRAGRTTHVRPPTVP